MPTQERDPRLSQTVYDWIERAVAAMKDKPPAGTLTRLSDEGDALRAQAGITPYEKARLHLTTAGTRMMLVEQGRDRRRNATEGFRDLQAALRLAPEDALIARSWGQTMYAMNSMGFIMRRLSQMGLGINIADETRKAIGLFAAHPDDAECQVGRALLARELGDKTSERDAAALLSKLPPADVARARAAYDATKNQAKGANDDP